MFEPERHVQEQRAHLARMAEEPGFLHYAATEARRLVAEDHGLWAPLADLADDLKQRCRALHTDQPHRGA